MHLICKSVIKQRYLRIMGVIWKGCYILFSFCVTLVYIFERIEANNRRIGQKLETEAGISYARVIAVQRDVFAVGYAWVYTVGSRRLLS